MYDRKKIRSAQNVKDVSFFVVTSRWSLVFRCLGTWWLPLGVVQRACLHPVEQTSSLGPPSIEWKVVECVLWIILVVGSYSQRALWYHLVAIRPQTVKSLCISVIPGSVMLTHIVLEGFITEFNHTLITLNISKESTYYNNMVEGHLMKITAEGMEDNVSPSTPTA